MYCCVLIVRIVGLQGYLFSYKVLYSALMKISATRNSYKIFDVLCLLRSFKVVQGRDRKQREVYYEMCNAHFMA